jgi:glycoprotease/Kae1 family metallohydrolase
MKSAHSLKILNGWKLGNALQRFNLSSKPFRVLAIETSCDDTAVAILDSSGKVLAEESLHQHQIHSQYGGIVPYLASNAHKARLPMVLEKVLASAGRALYGHDSGKFTITDIHAVAATRGPGIPGSLSVGYDSAKLLASAAGSLPFYPVNHMEAHFLIARLPPNHVSFPFIALLISGGHTMLVWVRNLGDYSILGETLDISIGQAIDHASIDLGLPYDTDKGPAASLVEAATSQLLGIDQLNYQYERGSGRPLNINSTFSKCKNTLYLEEERVETLISKHLKNIATSNRLKNTFDFSFSGIRTAFKTICEKIESEGNIPDLDKGFILSRLRSKVAAAFLDVCADQLANQLIKLVHRISKMPSFTDSLRSKSVNVVVSGGVARNEYIVDALKRKFDAFNLTQEFLASDANRCISPEDKLKICMTTPPPNYCVDNAVMIGWTALEYINSCKSIPNYPSIKPNWSLNDLKL